jgi:hypothetical protein
MTAPTSDRRAKRIFVLSELYYPEETSTGYLLTKTAEGLAHEFPVTVITGPSTSFSERAEAPAQPTGPVTIPSGATVKDVSSALGVPVAGIIKFMMGVGEMVQITQTLSDEAIELIAAEFDREVTIKHADEEDVEPESYEDDPADLAPRPPGRVDGERAPRRDEADELPLRRPAPAADARAHRLHGYAVAAGSPSFAASSRCAGMPQ